LEQEQREQGSRTPRGGVEASSSWMVSDATRLAGVSSPGQKLYRGAFRPDVASQPRLWDRQVHGESSWIAGAVVCNPTAVVLRYVRDRSIVTGSHHKPHMPYGCSCHAVRHAMATCRLCARLARNASCSSARAPGHHAPLPLPRRHSCTHPRGSFPPPHRRPRGWTRG
jgi:hypothetical protein